MDKTGRHETGREGLYRLSLSDATRLAGTTRLM